MSISRATKILRLPFVCSLEKEKKKPHHKTGIKKPLQIKWQVCLRKGKQPEGLQQQPTQPKAWSCWVKPLLAVYPSWNMWWLQSTQQAAPWINGLSQRTTHHYLSWRSCCNNCAAHTPPSSLHLKTQAKWKVWLFFNVIANKYCRAQN